MLGNYLFIDGSALTAQIRKLQRANPAFAERKLCPVLFVKYLTGPVLDELHEGQYKRATFYFARGDEVNIGQYLVVPDRAKPGHVRDVHFKFCGQKLKRSAEFTDFVEKIVPAKFQDRFQKSEKGVDIEMCCDALKLASASRIERLFLLTNDDDFLPFCRTIKEFGANISLLHLSDIVQANASLLDEVDSYDVVPLDALQAMFLPLSGGSAPLSPVSEEAAQMAQKPERPERESDAAPITVDAEPEPTDLGPLREPTEPKG